MLQLIKYLLFSGTKTGSVVEAGIVKDIRISAELGAAHGLAAEVVVESLKTGDLCCYIYVTSNFTPGRPGRMCLSKLGRCL